MQERREIILGPRSTASRRPDAVLPTDLLEELIQDQDGDVCNAAADAISKVVRGF